MSRPTQPYNLIFVHADVVRDARLAIHLLEDGQTTDLDWILGTLKNLADPLPEPDIYGCTPGIQTVELPVYEMEAP